ncbi:MAG: hypothetical protein ACXWMJ_04320 [Syntrophales bacterium]
MSRKDISRHFNKTSGEKYPEESNAPHVGAFFFVPKTGFDFKDTLIDMTPCLINEDERGFF